MEPPLGTWESTHPTRVRQYHTIVSIHFVNSRLALLMSELSNQDSDVVQRLRSYISALPTPTAIPSAIQTLVRLLLLYTAWTKGSSHLLLGTNLTSLSISLISSISQGGGFTVREESFEEWTPSRLGNGPSTIRVNRPLQDITLKECAVWAWWNGLRVLVRDKFINGKKGIGALTRGNDVFLRVAEHS